MFSKKKHWPKTRLFLPETVVGHGHLQNDMLMIHDHGKGNDFERDKCQLVCSLKLKAIHRKLLLNHS